MFVWLKYEKIFVTALDLVNQMYLLILKLSLFLKISFFTANVLCNKLFHSSIPLWQAPNITMPVMAYDIHNLKITVFIYAPIWGNSGFCYLFCTGVFKLMPLTDGGFSTRSFWALFSGLAVTAVYRCIFLECLYVHFFPLCLSCTASLDFM